MLCAIACGVRCAFVSAFIAAAVSMAAGREATPGACGPDIAGDAKRSRAAHSPTAAATLKAAADAKTIGTRMPARSAGRTGAGAGAVAMSAAICCCGGSGGGVMRIGSALPLAPAPTLVS